MSMSENGETPIETLDVFLTADEAFPAFERLFLSAETAIRASFRVFDLETRLRSVEARAIGETWFDLFEHTLTRGVNITLVVADFDPIVATKYHRKSWKSAHQLAAVDVVSGRGKLEFRIARHPARAGIVPRTLLRKRVRDKLLEQEPDRHTPGLFNVSENDLFELSPVTHHQKLAVFDERVLYIGGLDLDERRYDTKEHARAAHETWQDVQVAVTGSVVGAALNHLQSFEDVVAARRKPVAKHDGFLRTLSAKRWPAPFHISPKTLVNELEDAHLAAFAQAKELVYLETQFLRHLPLAEKIAEAGTNKANLRLIVVVPAAPEDVAFEDNRGLDSRMGEQLQSEALSIISQAYGKRALVCSPARRIRTHDTSRRDTLKASPIIYVHSKVSIFDETQAIVSSANLNGRSFRWDTEAGVQLTKSAHVRLLRKAVFDHWIPPEVTSEAGSLAEVYQVWRKTVLEDSQKTPEQRVSRLLPYDRSAAQQMGKPVPYVPNELV